MPNQTKFREGDEVIYRAGWGAEPGIHCTITGIGEHHGRRVYDNDLDQWGYEDQYELVARDYSPN